MKLSIAKKLWLGFGTILFLLILTGIVIETNLRIIKKNLELLTQVEMPTAHSVSEMSLGLTHFGAGAFKYLADREPQYRKDAEEAIAQFERSRARYLKLATTEGEKRLGERLKPLAEAYFTLGRELMEAKDRGVLEADFRERVDKFVNQRFELHDFLERELLGPAHQRIERAKERAYQAVGQTHFVILIVTLLSLLIGSALASLIASGIGESVRALAEGAKRIGQGFLEHRVRLRTKDELAELGEAFNQMTESLEQTRQQTEKVQVEKLELAKEMSAGAALEVRNLLTVFQQGVDYLTRRIDHRDSQIAQVLQGMKEGVNRADYIVRGLSDVADVSQEKTELLPAQLPPRIEMALSEVKPLLEKYQIKVTKVYEPDLPPVRIDRMRMEQALMNLFLNAIQAMPEGGELRVKVCTQALTEFGLRVGRRREDFFKLGETAVVVEIEDTGPGIPEEILPKVFDPFFTTRRNQGGTGLGLAIVRSILEWHQGVVEITNRVEGGIRATLLLKRA